MTTTHVGSCAINNFVGLNIPTDTVKIDVETGCIISPFKKISLYMTGYVIFKAHLKNSDDNKQFMLRCDIISVLVSTNTESKEILDTTSDMLRTSVHAKFTNKLIAYKKDIRTITESVLNNLVKESLE